MENAPGTFVWDKTFQMKSLWSCMQEYNDVNKFCFDVRDRLDEVFQRTMGMKRAQNMSNQEKAALRILLRNKNAKVIIKMIQTKTSALHALTRMMSLMNVQDNS